MFPKSGNIFCLMMLIIYMIPLSSSREYHPFSNKATKNSEKSYMVYISQPRQKSTLFMSLFFDMIYINKQYMEGWELW